MTIRSTEPPEAERRGGPEQHLAHPEHLAQCYKVGKTKKRVLLWLTIWRPSKPGATSPRVKPSPTKAVKSIFTPDSGPVLGQVLFLSRHILITAAAPFYKEAANLLILIKRWTRVSRLLWLWRMIFFSLMGWRWDLLQALPFSPFSAPTVEYTYWHQPLNQEDLRSPQSISYSEDEREVYKRIQIGKIVISLNPGLWSWRRNPHPLQKERSRRQERGDRRLPPSWHSTDCKVGEKEIERSWIFEVLLTRVMNIGGGEGEQARYHHQYILNLRFPVRWKIVQVPPCTCASLDLA